MMTIGLFGIQDTACSSSPIYTHDHGMAAMRDRRVVTVVELERHTGVKHDNRLREFLPGLLNEVVPEQEEVTFVSCNHFVGDSFITHDGSLRIEPERRPNISSELVPARCLWYPDGRNRRHAKAWVIPHELAHLGTCLPFCRRFEPNSLLVHIDGGASRSASSFWYTGDGRTLECLHHSWDDLKQVVNNFNDSPLSRAILGLRSDEHLAMPGKLMGLAGHGAHSPSLMSALEKEGWFLDFPGTSDELRLRVSTLIGSIEKFDSRDTHCQKIAATIQRAFETRIVDAISKFARRTGARRLYYSGGAALNIITNSLLASSGHFDSVFVPPPASDSGLALGAAAYFEYLTHGELSEHSPFLNGLHRPDSELTGTPDVSQVASMIAAGKVVGLCVGAGEVGPRALGHRSILCRPDDPALRRRVSEGIKRREWYRPVAPVVTEEVAQIMLSPGDVSSPLLTYMLGAVRIPPGWQPSFAGVVHSDGTARLQVVRRDDEANSVLYDLLRVLWHEYSIPGLINTSLNLCGRPMAMSAEQAVHVAEQLCLDYLVLGQSIKPRTVMRSPK
jgi:carbamoyltransferase